MDPAATTSSGALSHPHGRCVWNRRSSNRCRGRHVPRIGARFIMVGMPDTAVRESRERIKSALLNSGFGYQNKSVTINVAPANVRKEGAAFDLPMALGILGAMGIVKDADKHLFVGERFGSAGTLSKRIVRPVPSRRAGCLCDIPSAVRCAPASPRPSSLVAAGCSPRTESPPACTGHPAATCSLRENA